MKKTAFIIAALLAATAVGAEEISLNSGELTTKGYRLDVTPDFFNYHSTNTFHSIKGRIRASVNTYFAGIRVGRERIKPRAFYSGTDVLLAAGHTSSKFSLHQSEPVRPQTETVHSSAMIANIEQRLGYTFTKNNDSKLTMTPFTGFGGYYWDSSKGNIISSSQWAYALVGVLIEETLTKTVNLGFSCKALNSLGGTHRFSSPGYKQKSRMQRNILGYEASLPISWRLENFSDQWSLRFQPYILKFSFRESARILGMRLNASYSF